ncbi:MAG: L,D-transpeptidase [Ectothiorhodospiraceae bacterium]|jgi:hypothetical protein|nr:L,D-transpeptidase [Ectothiorhodospiraceae bacterium]
MNVQAAEALCRAEQARIRRDFPRQRNDPLLLVDVEHQRMYLFGDDRLLADYPVSTARNGIGNREGSHCTPSGVHRVREKIGDGAPSGMIFRGRVATGECATDSVACGDSDRITSRILWLEGLEPGINQGHGIDSCERYIYIHGTDEEGRIGQPVSHGCIRMRNADVIALFDRVPEGVAVVIRETSQLVDKPMTRA